MPPLVVERLESRAGSWGRDPDNSLRFQVTGTDSDSLAVAMVDAYAPAIYEGLIKQKIVIDPGEAPDIWYCDVPYGPMERPEPGKVQWQFNVGGVSRHITHGLSHIQSYFPSGAPTTTNPHEGAINVHKDGNGELVIDGMDVGGAGGSFTWSETHWITYASFTPAYVLTLYGLATAYPVNNAAWRIWAAGEVRLLGVSGSATGENQVELTFNFAAEPNLTGLTKGTITGIACKGWDYLWLEADTGEDTDIHRLVKKVTAVHVEQVYGYGNFGLLGLANVYWGQ